MMHWADDLAAQSIRIYSIWHQAHNIYPSAPDQNKVINYSDYMQPRPLMVAESPTPYGADSET